MKTPLSILEFGYIKPPKLSAEKMLSALFDEISRYEGLGYKRFWMTEHYSPEFAWFSPELLLPLLANRTQRIKIGWAGVLLRFHNPLLVASNMKLLSALFPGRIDLGVALAGASKQAQLLLEGSPTETKKKLATLVSLLNGTQIASLGTQGTLVPPEGVPAPPLWYLGASGNYTHALDNRMNFALTFMHPGSNYKENIDTIKRYKEDFFNKYDVLPNTSVLVSCACTAAPRIKKVLDRHYNKEGFKNFFGTPDFIQNELYALQEQVGNDEFVLANPICDRQRRMDSYTNLSSIVISSEKP